jgi:hypothetical protein
MNYKMNGLKATIKRTTRKQQGWYITETKLFHKVCTGHTVRYYPKTVSPFYNLYRITSVAGTPDFVIHSCK